MFRAYLLSIIRRYTTIGYVLYVRLLEDDRVRMEKLLYIYSEYPLMMVAQSE
jgi:hypothetical protein